MKVDNTDYDLFLLLLTRDGDVANSRPILPSPVPNALANSDGGGEVGRGDNDNGGGRERGAISS